MGITLHRGDLTTDRSDVLVTAANSALAGGGGVDGAIHRAAGPALLAECRRIGRCATGDAVLTGPGDLPVRYVAHAVGPVWAGGDRGEPALLASCHRRAVELAAGRGCGSIAFPAISCGVYGYPPALAAPVAVGAVAAALAEFPAVTDARFWLFDDATHAAFARALAALPE